MSDTYFDFGDGPMRSRLDVNEWIRDVADDDIAAAFADNFDIRQGKPRLNEGQSLFNFFPRLALGVTCRNGRTLVAELGNTEEYFGIYGPDIVIRWTDDPPHHAVALVDVERKTRDQLFTHLTLPINVPYLTLRAHTGKTPYTWPDGTWRKAGKLWYFEKHPDQTFFLAVSPGAQDALLVTGRDIVEREPVWIRANGGFEEYGDAPNRRVGQILVVRVPRERATNGKANAYDIENAVMNAPLVRQEVAA